MRSITTDFWTKMVVMKNQLLGANFKGILSTDYNKSVFLQVIHMKTLTVTVHILWAIVWRRTGVENSSLELCSHHCIYYYIFLIVSFYLTELMADWCQNVHQILLTIITRSLSLSPYWVPAGSPSRGRDVAIYLFEINQPSLPTLFYSVLVSAYFVMALSTVFHSMNSPDNSLLSHSVLLV